LNNTLRKEQIIIWEKRCIFFQNRNEPKQQYVTAGYFGLQEKLIERSNTVLPTQKGLAFLGKVFQVEQKKKLLTKIV